MPPNTYEKDNLEKDNIDELYKKMESEYSEFQKTIKSQRNFSQEKKSFVNSIYSEAEKVAKELKIPV